MADFASMIYGTAQNAAQEQGQGLAQSVQGGAELALKSQQLDQAQQAMQVKMQELQQQKIQKVYDFLGNAHNYTMAGDRNNYVKAGIGLRNASGLTDKQIPDSAFTGMGSDDNMGRDVSARQMVAAGLMTPEQYFKAKADPQAWSQLPVASPESYSMADTDVTSAIKDYTAAAQKRSEDALNRENQLKIAGVRSAGQVPAGTKELSDFGKQVANPSTRAALGRPKQMIDAADAIKQLTDGSLPANATRAQRVAAYNNLDTRQIAEVTKGLDRLLSQSNPSVHGNEALSPPTTPETFLAKWGEKAGNVPQGASQGEFIDRMMGTVNRERALNEQKFKASAAALKVAYPIASKQYDKEMDDIIGKVTAAPPSAQQVSSGVQYAGHTWTTQQLEAKIAATAAKNPNDPGLAGARAALNAAQQNIAGGQ